MIPTLAVMDGAMKEFSKPTADAAACLAAATVGLVSKAEFTKRREELEVAAVEQSEGEKKKKEKKNKKTKAPTTLSFGDEEEDDPSVATSLPKKPKIGKNPSIDTSFLPDRERDEAEKRRREELAEEYRKQQDAIKAEVLEVTYSYHDPSGRDGMKGHRNSTCIAKGCTSVSSLQALQARDAGRQWLQVTALDLTVVICM